MFLNIVKSDVCNFEDDNKSYSFDKKSVDVFSILKYVLKNALNWFQVNSLTENPSKFKTSFALNFNDKKINYSSEVSLLGIAIDNQLQFKTHIENLCNQVSFKLHALHRIRKYLKVQKAKIIAIHK